MRARKTSRTVDGPSETDPVPPLLRWKAEMPLAPAPPRCRHRKYRVPSAAACAPRELRAACAGRPQRPGQAAEADPTLHPKSALHIQLSPESTVQLRLKRRSPSHPPE